MMDFTSRYPEHSATAEAVSNAMLSIFSRFGIPKEILTDNRACFVGQLTEQLMKLLGVETTAYRPQSNGMLEQRHKVLKEVGGIPASSIVCLP